MSCNINRPNCGSTESTESSQNKSCEAGLGKLPGCLPYAVPFVTPESAAPSRYSQEMALANGTLFPDLNLPFHLKVDAPDLSNTPLNQLRALEFVVQELGLYLDTHPEDHEAFSLFQQYSKLAKAACERYEAEHGPLTQMCAAESNSYTWVNGPWPWQYQEKEA